MSVSKKGLQLLAIGRPGILLFLRDVQKAGGLGVRIEVNKSNKKETVFIFRKQSDFPGHALKLSALRNLLNIEPGQQEYRVVYGSSARDKTEIAVLTRSLIEILIEMYVYFQKDTMILTRLYATLGFILIRGSRKRRNSCWFPISHRIS